MAVLATSSAALRVQPGVSARGLQTAMRPIVRAAQPLLQQKEDSGSPVPVSDEQLMNAASAAAGETELWPEQKPAAPSPTDTSIGPSEGFDPRVIIYVSLPALVLLGQLFFTFSRDTLGETALGPAIMDLYMP